MKKGDNLHWKWGKSEAKGTITETHTEPAKIKSKGKVVKRKASRDEPAYTLEQENGTKVLKSESELKKGTK